MEGTGSQNVDWRSALEAVEKVQEACRALKQQTQENLERAESESLQAEFQIVEDASLMPLSEGADGEGTRTKGVFVYFGFFW